MVSQLATTCAGMNALASTSFLKTLVDRIWESLECEIDDDRLVKLDLIGIIGWFLFAPFIRSLIRSLIR